MVFHPQGPSVWELARQALSSTAHGYDLLAPTFDYTPFRTPEDLVAAAIAAATTPDACERGLDLCCGTGVALPHLQRLCRRQVVALDFSAGMLGQAQRQTTAAPGTPVTFVQADALALPLASAQFDVVVCFGALGHILPRNGSIFLGEIARVLAPGGRFVTITAMPPPWWSVRNLLARGFNAGMHLRNALWRPPFVMYYLTFLLPDLLTGLAAAGLNATATDTAFAPPYASARVVIARRPVDTTGHAGTDSAPR
jgi:ubiquinone/menaquinone biosynthesis C-methylase UbiE